MSFRRRTFPEVLENLLTTLTGGVASESQPFPPPGATTAPYTLVLQQPPAADVVSVWGARDGEPHEFRKGTDYQLSDDGRTIVLPEKGAEFPDPASLLYVNYVPAAAQPELTDLQIGSVLRTLCETTALELGRIYALLETVYQSGFVDTASADALDNVVALLGIERVRGGRPAGVVEFTRASGDAGRADDSRRHARRDRRRQGPVRDHRDRGDEPGAELDPGQRARPRPERPAAGGQAHAAARADRRGRLGHEPRADRGRDPGRDRRGAAHEGEELPPRQRAGDARRARAGASRRRHHRRHRRGHDPGHGRDHAARRHPAARPPPAADRLDRARPPRRGRGADRGAAASAQGRSRAAADDREGAARAGSPRGAALGRATGSPTTSSACRRRIPRASTSSSGWRSESTASRT